MRLMTTMACLVLLQACSREAAPDWRKIAGSDAEPTFFNASGIRRNGDLAEIDLRIDFKPDSPSNGSLAAEGKPRLKQVMAVYRIDCKAGTGSLLRAIETAMPAPGRYEPTVTSTEFPPNSAPIMPDGLLSEPMKIACASH